MQGIAKCPTLSCPRGLGQCLARLCLPEPIEYDALKKNNCVGLQTEDCVEAHTNVDVVVNVAELRALLETCLPHVFDGASVDSASLPWPPAD